MPSEQEPTEEDQPEIHYVPGAWNHYKFYDDVVVLDSRLKEYPAAHDEIKAHEVGHADARASMDLLRHEFWSDVELYFSTDEAAEEVREYYQTEHSREKLGPLRRFGHWFVHWARPIWSGVMAPLGRLYRWWSS